MNSYACTTDRVSRVITVLVCLITLSMLPMGIITYQKDRSDMWVAIVPSIIFVGFVIMAIAMYMYSPKGITLDSNSITIERKLKPVRIAFSDIKEMRRTGPTEMLGVVRTFGNGGLFGYTGMYYNKQLGSMRWYCSQRKNYVIIDTHKNKRIVISPDEPEALLNTIRSMKPGFTV